MTAFTSTTCPGRRGGGGDDAGDGSGQPLGFAPLRPVEIRAAVLQSLQLQLGVFDLRPGDDIRDGAEALEPALHQCDLLVQFARLLLLRRHVGGADRGLDEGEDVARRDALSKTGGKPPGGGERKGPVTEVWTLPLADGSGMMTRPGRLTARRCSSSPAITVRIPRIRWVALGTKTAPSGKRCATSTVATAEAFWA